MTAVHELPGPAVRLLTAVPTGDPTVAELADLVRRLADLVARLEGTPPPVPTAVREPLRLGRLQLDPVSYRAVVDGRPVDLTAREFQLLEELGRSAGRVLGRAELLGRLGDDDGGRGRVVDVHVARLRRKLGPLAGQLVTVRGVGYRLDPS